MPLLQTFGNSAVRGFRTLVAGIGGPYWINIFGQYGATTAENNSGVAVDSTGNVYTIGYTSSPGYNVNQTAKFNISGAVQWQYRFGSGAPYYINYPRNCAVDSAGNLYSASNWWSSTVQGIIYKQNTSGTGVYRIPLPDNNGSSTVDVQGITIDSSDNAYIAGYTGNQGKGFIIKVNSAGTELMNAAIRAPSAAYYHYCIASDSSGNSYAGGIYLSVGQHFVLSKVDSGGTYQWSKYLTSGGNIVEGFYGVVANSSGDVYATGYSNATGNNDIITAKYNSSGALQWQRRLAGSSNTNDMASGIVMDKSGNVYICGSTNPGNSVYCIFVAKYNSSGTLQWQRTIGSSGKSWYGQRIFIDSGDNLYVAGATDITGGDDAVTIKMKSDGSQTGTYTVGSYSVTIAASSLTGSTSTLTDSDAPSWVQATPSVGPSVVSAGVYTATTWSSTTGTM